MKSFSLILLILFYILVNGEDVYNFLQFKKAISTASTKGEITKINIYSSFAILAPIILPKKSIIIINGNYNMIKSNNSIAIPSLTYLNITYWHGSGYKHAFSISGECFIDHSSFIKFLNINSLSIQINGKLFCYNSVLSQNGGYYIVIFK